MCEARCIYDCIHCGKRRQCLFDSKEIRRSRVRIVTDNELSNPSRLTVGQSIVILYPTETYTVRGGDTLDAVSRRTGVSLNELWRNNPTLGGKSTVYPGQTLNIRYEAPPLGDVYTNGYVYTYVNRDVLRKTLPYLTYLSVFSHGFRRRIASPARRRRRRDHIDSKGIRHGSAAYAYLDNGKRNIFFGACRKPSFFSRAYFFRCSLPCRNCGRKRLRRC